MNGHWLFAVVFVVMSVKPLLQTTGYCLFRPMCSCCIVCSDQCALFVQTTCLLVRCRQRELKMLPTCLPPSLPQGPVPLPPPLCLLHPPWLTRPAGRTPSRPTSPLPCSAARPLPTSRTATPAPVSVVRIAPASPTPAG